MNHFQRILGGILVVSFALSGTVYAVDAASAAKDHLAMAASYDQQAAQQNALIAEHEQMKKDYMNRYYINDKVTPKDKLKPMERHCNAIIHAAKKEKQKFSDFAKWHRMRAAELQGQ